jgi:hypothetical protein
MKASLTRGRLLAGEDARISGREVRFLLACCRAAIANGAAKPVRPPLEPELDWRSLIDAASRHAVLPLLCRALRELGAEAVPTSVTEELAARFEANAKRNLFLTYELIDVLDLLRANGVAALPFKGPLLAISGYRDLALRQFVDLDILVQGNDLARAEHLLVGRGYRALQQTGAGRNPDRSSDHASTLVGHGGHVKIDLHWEVAQSRYSFALDTDGLWRRAQKITVAGRQLTTLHPEDLLLVLLLHGSKHCWERLGWICDVAAVVRGDGNLDWDVVLWRSRELGIARAVLLGLILARNLLDLSLPAEILAGMEENPALRGLSRRIQRRLFVDSPARLGVIERAALFLRTRERFRDKVPYLIDCLRLSVALNENDLRLLPLPPPLYFLYYPLRILRLAAQHGIPRLPRRRIARQ